MKFVLQWIDLLWLALALALARKDQRAWVGGFFIGSMVMMRLMSELMGSIGFPAGLVGLLDTPVFTRGLILYSITYLAYMAYFYFSPNAHGSILMAGSLGLFFVTFVVYAFVMAL